MTDTSDKPKRGRPKVGSVSVHVRFPPEEVLVLDGWIELQKDPALTRPEAVRRLVTAGVLKRRHSKLP
mgnify:CR=1 FL=1